MPSIFNKIAQVASDAGNIMARTAANAHEVLSDRDLRRETGGKLVRGIHQGIRGGIQGIGSTADAVRRNVGDGLSSGRRGALGILEKVQAQMQQQRLQRALSQSRDKPIDVQIGFTVYIDVAQEMRSRLWLALLDEPALAAPFQELGRFPDLGKFDPIMKNDKSSPSHASSASHSTRSPGRSPSCSTAVSQAHSPSPSAHPPPERSRSPSAQAPHAGSPPHADRPPHGLAAQRGSSPSPEYKAGFVGSEAQAQGQQALQALQETDPLDISDAFSDESPPVAKAAAESIVRGGEVQDGDVRASQSGSGVRSPGDDGWEVIDKADSLQDGSHVGAAVLMRPPSNRLDAVQAESTAESKGIPERSPSPANEGKRGRVLKDASRRRLEQQEALALKLHVAEENIKDAIITATWPVAESRESESTFQTLLQVTVGQEDVEETIYRDIHRTFPEHPRFLLGQGQQELFNVLKAYSMVDMEVGYCQGMAFVAGILLMYLPEQHAFQLFSKLMSSKGCRLRRLYLDGLRDLKHEMSMFDWLLQRHHPKLSCHLQQHCVPSVLYISQWLLTCFACPFPAYFPAQLVDIMLIEGSDRIIMQTAMAIMAEVEERLLRLTEFEDIIRCLKTEPTQWNDDKLRGILAAAYLSSVSEAELRLASEAVASEMERAATGEAPLSAVGTQEHAQAGPSKIDAHAGAETPCTHAGVGTGDRGEGFASGSVERIAELLQSELQQLQWAEVSDTRDEGAAQATSLHEETLAEMLRTTSIGDGNHIRRLSHTPDPTTSGTVPAYTAGRRSDDGGREVIAS